MSDHSVRKSISAYFAAVSLLDAAAFAEVFAEDAEAADPVGTPVRRGRGEIRAGFAIMVERWKELAMEPARVFVCGNAAAVQWNAQGLGRNDRQVMFNGITVFTLDAQASIAHLESFWDPVPVLRELDPGQQPKAR